MENSLASQLELVQTMVSNLEDHDLPQAAREIVGEVASGLDKSLRMAKSCLPGAADTAVPAVAPKDFHHFRKRKGMPSVQKQVPVTSENDTAPLDDGFIWRKYGQKDIHGAQYPRAYFRCSYRRTQGCPATKQVQRTDADPLLFDVVYHGEHTCVQAANGSAEHVWPGYASAQEQSALQTPDISQAEGGDPLVLGHTAHSSAEELLRPGHAGMERLLRTRELDGGLQTGPFSFASPLDYADFDSFYPLLSPTSLEWQFPSSHASGDLHAGMEFEHQFVSNHEQKQFEYQDFPNPSDFPNYLWDL